MEIKLTQSQIEDSVDVLNTAVETVFSDPTQVGEYSPVDNEVPRPDFTSFKAHVEQLFDNPRSAGVMIGKSVVRLQGMNLAAATTRSDFDGLRGQATTIFEGNGEPWELTGPAIILEGGLEVAILSAQADPLSKKLTETQAGLLETEYIKHKAQVSDTHSKNDANNVGAIAPVLIVASSPQSLGVHSDMHKLAIIKEPNSTFGTNFSNDGRQDVQIGSQLLAVRPVIVPVSSVDLIIPEDWQAHDEQLLLGVDLSAEKRAAAMTLAATISRNEGIAPDLGNNMRHMAAA